MILVKGLAGGDSFLPVMVCLELGSVAFGHDSARPAMSVEVEARLAHGSGPQQRKAWKACAKISFQG